MRADFVMHRADVRRPGEKLTTTRPPDMLPA